MFNFNKIIIAVISAIVFSIVGLLLYDLYIIHTEGHVIGHVIEKSNIPGHWETTYRHTELTKTETVSVPSSTWVAAEYNIAVFGFRTKSHNADTEIYTVSADTYNSIKIGDKYPQ